MPVRSSRLVARAQSKRAQRKKMECAMRLTSTQVERALRQFDGQAIPDNHPVLPQLNRLFGDHTFFLDGNGLNIVEPVEPTQAGVEAGKVEAGKVVNVANWSDANLTSLAPHEPESTDVIVALGSKH
jgi:peptidoglycan hydrolase-like protein with peptidoglycan-binding domain